MRDSDHRTELSSLAGFDAWWSEQQAGSAAPRLGLTAVEYLPTTQLSLTAHTADHCVPVHFDPVQAAAFIEYPPRPPLWDGSPVQPQPPQSTGASNRKGDRLEWDSFGDGGGSHFEPPPSSGDLRGAKRRGVHR